MGSLTLEAYAKVNLGLAVTARRADGYHEIDTIFQTVSLSDTIRIESCDEVTTLSVTGLEVPAGRGNLAHRAAETLITRTGCSPVALTLTKRIPVAAGLGGGSSDAAAVLNGMNTLFGLRLRPEELEQIALELGSDVPFLVQGGTARGQGRGDVLTRLPGLTGVALVLVTPRVAVTAAQGYALARIGLTESATLIRLRCSAIQEGGTGLLELPLRNDLEAGVVSCCPDVAGARAALAEAGARAIVMSGSGPTVLALTRDDEEARQVASRVDGRGLQIHIVRPTATGSSVTRWDAG